MDERKYMSIIKASAGSGKTYTLARTYISHMLGMPTGKKVRINDKEVEQFKLCPISDYYKHILAITFTNKATNEMKTRIVNQLYLLSKGKGDFVDDFKLIFAENTFDEVRQAASKALSAILFDYDSFKVSTIDSFFQGIFRNFARELNYDYNYEVQLDLKYVTKVAVHDFLTDLGNNGKGQAAVDEWVKEFIVDNITKRGQWNFFGNTDSLEQFALNIHKEFFREFHDEVIDYLSDIGNGKGMSRIAKFRRQCIKQRNIYLKEYEDSIGKYKPFFDKYDLIEGVGKRSVVYKIYFGATELSEQNISTLKGYADTDCALTDKVLKKKFVDMVSVDAVDEFRNLCATTVKSYYLMSFFDSVLDNIWNLGLLGKINEKLELFRRETNSVLIADTNELIGKVLDSGAMFIYEHAGTTLRNYMIDEFQDTSRKQYSNFKPLLQESIDNGYNNLIIGDEKQSIYRFRNSDPSLLREELEQDYDVDVTSLDTNYRSLSAIVDFNNSFFTSLINDYKTTAPEYKSLIDTYANIVQHIHKNEGPKGLVRINFVEKSGKDSGDANVRQKIISALPAYINELRSSGYERKDIAILVNQNKEGNEIIEYLLRYNNSLSSISDPNYIDVVSDESLLLKNSPAVRLVISMLQFLDNSQYAIDIDNDSNESGVEKSEEEIIFQNYLRKRASELRRYRLLHDFEAQMHDTSSTDNPGEMLINSFERDYHEMRDLNDAERLELYSKIAQEVMPDRKNQLTNLVTIVEKIIDRYIVRLGHLDDSFLYGFLNVVIDFNHRHNGGTVSEFLKYWEIQKEKLSISSPSESNAVSVMTIHKSKGLEFKCVIIPFANWEIKKHDDLFWIKKSDWLKENNTSAILDGNDDSILPPLIPVGTSKLGKSNMFSMQYKDEMERCLIDNLNKMYVAFTRPKQELHVFVENIEIGKKRTPSNILDIKNTTSLICRLVPSMLSDTIDWQIIEQSLCCTAVHEGVNAEEAENRTLPVVSYQYGEPVRPKENKSDKDEDFEIREMSSYDVSAKVMPVKVSMHRASGAIKDEGIRMHELFSQIDSVDDFSRALNYGINNELFKNNRYWTVERFKQLLNTLQEDIILASWFDFDNVVYNERNLSTPDKGNGHKSDGEKIFEHNRPDRIVRRPDGEMIVVDYKFGFRHDAKTIAKDSQKVKTYLLRLKSLFNVPQMSGYLWYARNNQIVEVTV